MERPQEIVRNVINTAVHVGGFVMERLTHGAWTEFDNPSPAHIEHLRTGNEVKGEE